MKAESFIGFRYLWNTRRTRFLSVITLICIAGIMIGVAALICVQSVMDGLQNHMKKTILGAKTHISVQMDGGDIHDAEALRKKILGMNGVSGATPMISREVIISSNDEMLGAVFNGIDPLSAGTVLLFPSQITTGSMECLEQPSTCPEILKRTMASPSKLLDDDFKGDTKKNMPGIAIGTELAKFYGLEMGDPIKIISPVGGGMSPAGPVPLIRTFQVAAIFFSGLYEYDLNYVYVSINTAHDFFSTGGAVDSIGIKLKNVYEADDISTSLRKELGEKYIVSNWKQMNKQLFGALQMEKIVWFLILGFIILVAAFNIVSALIMLVMGKKEEIAILRAVGFNSRSVMKIFMLDGIVIGSTGTAAGMITGYFGCIFINGISIGLAQDVYYIDKIPVDMSIGTFAVAGLGSMILTIIATVYPGAKAARVNSSEVLRHE
ncbi:MAG TPA: ABC transporter permease [bacterium]|nr:ABC transporter permease [bacterium]HPS30760.1 ABC transporter permease [bacterium]